MFKKLAIASVLGTAMLAGPGFAATTTSAGFTVGVTLTSKCEFTAALPAIALTYESFQTDASTSSKNFDVRCTNDLPFSLLIDGGTTGSGTYSSSYIDADTQLSYSLKLDGTGADSASTSNTSGVLSGVKGSGTTAKTFKITGTIAGNQSGTTQTATVGNSHSIVVSY